MVYYEIEWNNLAKKELKKLEKKAIRRVSAEVNKLGKAGLHHASSTKMVSKKNEYRLRVGSYRVIYLIHKNKTILEVIQVRHRKNAY